MVAGKIHLVIPAITPLPSRVHLNDHITTVLLAVSVQDRLRHTKRLLQYSLRREQMFPITHLGTYTSRNRILHRLQVLSYFPSLKQGHTASTCIAYSSLKP
jgi:hypothetical protein